MGMFDYIRCEAPLPDGWRPDEPLQTKDFDCDMVCHIITAEGRLMLERIDETHLVPEEERPYPNDPGLLGMCGMLRSEKSQHESKFHGVVNFYGSEYRKPLRDIWHEYNAKFTDGRLVEIVAVHANQ